MTSMSRYYFPTDLEGDSPTEYPLHIFADASTKAYGTVVFICEGNTVIAKTRVAPIKQLALPQLELMAALDATRLGKLVVDSLSNHYKFSVHLWSDNQPLDPQWKEAETICWKLGTTNQSNLSNFIVAFMPHRG